MRMTPKQGFLDTLEIEERPVGVPAAHGRGVMEGNVTEASAKNSTAPPYSAPAGQRGETRR